MSKQTWRGGNMLYPVPAVMVSCGTYDPDTSEKCNVLTAAWTGTVCSSPAMVYVSIRPERHSYSIIKESGEFVINLTTEALVRTTDFVGVRSGKDLDKFEICHLTQEAPSIVKAPLIGESPVNLECKVKEIIPLGSHDMFLAEVVAVHVDESLLDEKGKLILQKAQLITYSHGEYYSLGKKLGTFGFSVKKSSKKHSSSKGSDRKRK